MLDVHQEQSFLSHSISMFKRLLVYGFTEASKSAELHCVIGNHFYIPPLLYFPSFMVKQLDSASAKASFENFIENIHRNVSGIAITTETNNIN